MSWLLGAALGAAVAWLWTRSSRALSLPPEAAGHDEKTQERLDALVNAMEAGVLVLDSEERIVMLNPAAAALVGAQLGSPLAQALSTPELEQMLDALRAKGHASAELLVPGPPARTLLARAARQSNSEVVMVLHDTTEVQRLEQIRQSFVANVSHELRTPLSVIQANTEALLDGAMHDKAARSEFLSATLRHTERLSQLVSDLLDLSAIEAGGLQLQSRRFALLPVVQRAIEVNTPQAESRKIQLHCRVAHLTELTADVSALEQVLVNLVDNAVKYGRPEGQVWVSAEPVDDGVRILVKDDGPGIDGEHHDRLFERFYRVDVGRSREVGGTGLGLAIVKHRVTDMGGQIGVRAREGGGIVFWVWLPA
jgi:two-component system phosphate regulon sensor histidine kinase PhoR